MAEEAAQTTAVAPQARVHIVSRMVATRRAPTAFKYQVFIDGKATSTPRFTGPLNLTRLYARYHLEPPSDLTAQALAEQRLRAEARPTISRALAADLLVAEEQDKLTIAAYKAAKALVDGPEDYSDGRNWYGSDAMMKLNSAKRALESRTNALREARRTLRRARLQNDEAKAAVLKARLAAIHAAASPIYVSLSTVELPYGFWQAIVYRYGQRNSDRAKTLDGNETAALFQEHELSVPKQVEVEVARIARDGPRKHRALRCGTLSYLAHQERLRAKPHVAQKSN